MTAPDIEAAVAAAVADPLDKIGARDIGPMFGRGLAWFDRAGVRGELYEAGFPRPISRGVWLKRDVVRFLLRRSAGLPTSAPAIAAAAAEADFDGVAARTRRHLHERRR